MNPKQAEAPVIELASQSVNPKHLTHPKYRPDIDGLRAIAVLSVVAFHAFPRAIKGGFIGVDIFFVISGFLISTIIFDNLKNNQFSFVEFYSRRIKRIFPALILVLVSSYGFGWFALLTDEYKQLGKHIVGGAGFISNFILWRESGYFDLAAETKPLLHLWSLGIEEQFYIVWPLLLWMGWKTRINLLGVTLGIGLLSFVLNIAQSGTHAVADFYSPQTRFWELLVGSSLAYVKLIKLNPIQQQNSHIANLQSWLGAALIFGGMGVITKENAFPGWWALLPTLGAALLISAGTLGWINRVILTNRVVVWFGLISFPLYLWHWPLLVFIRITNATPPTVAMRSAAILMSIILAWLTFKFIERPIRFGPKNNFKTVMLVAMMMAVGGLGYNCYQQNGFEEYGYRVEGRTEYANYFINSTPELRYFKNNGIFEKYALECDFYDLDKFRLGQVTAIPRPAIAEHCYQRDTRYKSAVLVWGDSHAQHLYHGLKNNLPKDWQLLQVASVGCQPNINISEPSTTDYCQQSNWFALKTISDIKPDVVIISQNVDHNIDAFNKISEKLKSLGVGKVIFVGPAPHWMSNLSDIIVRKLWTDTPTRTFIGINNKVLLENRKLQEQFTQTETTIFANLIDVFCNEQGCLTYLGDDKLTGITTWDSGHFTPIASDYAAKNLLVKLIVGGTF